MFKCSIAADHFSFVISHYNNHFSFLICNFKNEQDNNDNGGCSLGFAFERSTASQEDR